MPLWLFKSISIGIASHLFKGKGHLSKLMQCSLLVDCRSNFTSDATLLDVAKTKETNICAWNRWVSVQRIMVHGGYMLLHVTNTNYYIMMARDPRLSYGHVTSNQHPFGSSSAAFWASCTLSKSTRPTGSTTAVRATTAGTGCVSPSALTQQGNRAVASRPKEFNHRCLCDFADVTFTRAIHAIKSNKFHGKSF